MSTKKKKNVCEFVNQLTGEVLPFRSAYDGVKVVEHYPSGEAITKQAFKDQCDINAIIARWNSVGVLDHVNVREGVYGDFFSITDYTSSVRRVEAAMEDFMALPADIRSAFDNDPGKLIDGITDPERAEEMRGLGLGELVDYYHGAQEDEQGAPPGASEAPPEESPPEST